MDWLEPVGVGTGIICVYLQIRENIWNWPIALINVSVYFVVFRESKLYADMGLQLIYFVLSLCGWYEWLYGGKNKTELKISRVSSRMAVTLAAIGVVGV